MLLKRNTLLLVLLDIGMMSLSLFVSIILIEKSSVPLFGIGRFLLLLSVFAPIFILTYYYFGMYSQVWEFASAFTIITINVSSIIATSLTILANQALGPSQAGFSTVLHFGIFNWVILAGSRLFWKLQRMGFAILKAQGREKRALFVGAGHTGNVVLREIMRDQTWDLKPVCFVDDDEAKRGGRVMGIPVLGGVDQIPSIVESRRIDTILITVPTARPEQLKRILGKCWETSAEVKIFPGVEALLNGRPKSDGQLFREVRMEDLIKRSGHTIETAVVQESYTDKNVLITGAAGSIGSELTKKLLQYRPGLLALLDHDENGLYVLKETLSKLPYKGNVRFILADVKDDKMMRAIIEETSPDFLFHAAAYKHVPLMQEFPKQVILNNTYGTKVTAEAASELGVKTFVQISTDKAVNPRSLMGCSKRIAEIVVREVARRGDNKNIVVRFGNVLYSRGSVVPRFIQQIREGGPVTVTDPEVTRYFMSLDEAIMMILYAAVIGENGRTFILKMGNPISIKELAQDLIRLYGPSDKRSVKIEYTGLRPGEKLHEELLYETERESSTEDDHFYIFDSLAGPSQPEVTDAVSRLWIECGERRPSIEVHKILKEIVPEFKPPQVVSNMDTRGS